jgi:bacterioferritin
MRGNADVLALLNSMLASELTAADQYLLHADMAKNWGFLKIGERLHEESLGERQHAQLLIDRILFLDGVPAMVRHEVTPRDSVKGQLEHLLQTEYDAIAGYNQAVETSRSVGDNASADLFTRILNDEQDDTHWLEAQLTLIKQVGEGNYLAQQL